MEEIEIIFLPVTLHHLSRQPIILLAENRNVLLPNCIGRFGGRYHRFHGNLPKAQVRQMAAAYGLPVASRPSVPCLATRIPYGTPLDTALLSRIDQGEHFLRSLGVRNVRIRVHGDIARLETDPEDLPLLLKHRPAVVRQLKGLGIPYLTLDLEGFRSGSMDIKIKNGG